MVTGAAGRVPLDIEAVGLGDIEDSLPLRDRPDLNAAKGDGSTPLQEV